MRLRLTPAWLVAALLLVPGSTPLAAQEPGTPRSIGEVRARARHARAILDSALARGDRAALVTLVDANAMLLTESRDTVRGRDAIIAHFEERFGGKQGVEVIRTIRTSEECAAASAEAGEYTAYTRTFAATTPEPGSYTLLWSYVEDRPVITAITMTDANRGRRAVGMFTCPSLKRQVFAARRFFLGAEGAMGFGGPGAELRHVTVAGGWSHNTGICETRPRASTAGSVNLQNQQSPARLVARARIASRFGVEVTQQLGADSACISGFKGSANSVLLHGFRLSERTVALTMTMRSLMLSAGVGMLSASYSAREDSTHVDGWYEPMRTRRWSGRENPVGLMLAAAYVIPVTSHASMIVQARTRRGAKLSGGELLRTYTTEPLRLDRTTLGLGAGVSF